MGKNFKGSRYIAAIVLALVSSVAVLVVLYTPLGRQLERAGTRASRVVRNVTRVVYPRPLVILRFWRNQVAFRLELYESGRLVVYWNGKHERQVGEDVVQNLYDLANTARGDFGSAGCMTGTSQVNADLYVMLDGSWHGSGCRGLSRWPLGAGTRQFLDELGDHLPEGITIPREFVPPGRGTFCSRGLPPSPA